MAMKRELGLLTGDVDMDAPRTKRRKEQMMGATQLTTLPVESTNTGSNQAKYDGMLASNGQSGLREQASRMWQVVKDAVNKEGNICSPPFMRLPPKRHYPDYYDVITHPICLDDIKKKIDEGRYPSLDDVRQEFELCFTNAKRYNLKDSPIWLDAKFLLKVANKEYSRITGKKAKKSGDPDGDGEEKAEGEGDNDKQKSKLPNMNRLLKTRLQKLVEKTDEETHRVLSDVFMEMPSKKDYPTYYKEIKRPMCIENIFRRLKRKEYNTADEFANDVELVFSNALAFNLEHSQIWQDAITLRDHFRQLMSDLPPPYSLPRYAKSSGKIKFKVPGANAAAAAPAASHNGASPLKPVVDQTSSNPLTLRLPAASSLVPKSPQRAIETLPRAPSTSSIPATPLAPTPTPVPAPAPESAAAPSQGPTNVPTPSSTATSPTPASTPLSAPVVTVAPQAPSKVAAPTPKVAVQPLAYATPTQYTHYPNAAYHQVSQPVATSQPSTSAVTPPTQARAAHSVSRSPAPSLSGHRHLKEISIVTKPRGRPLSLDHRDGVKTWAIRLVQGELSLSIMDVKFFGEEDKESSDEDLCDLAEEEEEEEEEPIPKRRGRGRPARNHKIKLKPTGKKVDQSVKKVAAQVIPPHENIQVVMNGTPTTTKADQRMWEVEPQVGSNVLEIGEKGGYVWKVYLERPSIT